MGYRLDLSLLPHIQLSELDRLSGIADQAATGLKVVLRGEEGAELLEELPMLAFYQDVVNNRAIMSIVSQSYSPMAHAVRRWHRRLDEARMTCHRCYRREAVRRTKISQAQKTLGLAAQRLTEVSRSLWKFAKRNHGI